MADTKAKANKVTRTEWSGVQNGVRTRTVNTNTRNGNPIAFTEYNLVDVKDLSEAAGKLKLKGAAAIRALIIGANKLSRKKAAGSAKLAEELAEHMGITLDEARAMLSKKSA